MKCVTCGHPEMVADQVDETVPVGGLTFTLAVPGQVCPKCGENYLDVATLRQVDRLIAGELAREGVATSEAFRFMRKVIGLRAREVAKLFGVAHETVSRWENGDREPAGGAAALLAVLVNQHLAGRSEALEQLRAARQEPSDRPAVRCLAFPVQAAR